MYGLGLNERGTCNRMLAHTFCPLVINQTLVQIWWTSHNRGVSCCHGPHVCPEHCWCYHPGWLLQWILSKTISLFLGLYGRYCLCQVHDANEQGWDHHVLQGQFPLLPVTLTWILQNALITMRNGALYLLVRLADLRMKHLIECHVNGHFLMKVIQKTPETSCKWT